MVSPDRIFLLSPAWAGGKRYSFLLREQADFELAIKLRQGAATIGEIYSFISGLYFRGKMAYADAFRAAPEGLPPAVIITPGLGLITPETRMDIDQLRAVANVPVSEENSAFRDTLFDAAKILERRTNGTCSYVLLGSVASSKYTGPLLEVFGERLLFPADFVGRGDMSRGGLMLRRSASRIELDYVSVQGAQLRGSRPSRLEKQKAN